MQAYIHQLHQYAEEQGLEQFEVFGYSMGGYVALCYAAQYPGRITSLLTLAAKLSWTVEGAAREAKMLNPAAIEEKVPKYAAQLSALHGDLHWKELLPAIAGMINHLGQQPILDTHSYNSIGTRVQLMVGDKDVMVTLEETLQVAHLIPEARLAVLPGTKHPIEQVRPELLMAMMKDFWNL